MAKEYYGYMTAEQMDDYHNRLTPFDDKDDESNTDNTFTLPVASWRNPAPLDGAQNYQMACLGYALLLTAGSTIAEFEKEIEDPDFWAGYRLTHEVENEERALDAIHFIKGHFVERETIPPQVRAQIFRLLLGITGTFGISGKELIRKIREDLKTEGAEKR